MQNTIQKITQTNNQLEQFKSSIDVLENQNNEYLNTLKSILHD